MKLNYTDSGLESLRRLARAEADIFKTKGQSPLTVLGLLEDIEVLKLELKTLRGAIHCAYCDYQTPADDTAPSLIELHIRFCSNHPMRLLEKELAALRPELAGLRAHVGNLRKEISSFSDENVSLRREVDSLRTDANFLHQETASLRCENARLSQENGSLNQENGRLKEGNFTEGEFQNLCHNTPVGLGSSGISCRQFISAYFRYQVKLMGAEAASLALADDLIRASRKVSSWTQSNSYGQEPWGRALAEALLSGTGQDLGPNPVQQPVSCDVPEPSSSSSPSPPYDRPHWINGSYEGSHEAGPSIPGSRGELEDK